MNVHSGKVGGSHDRRLATTRSWALHPGTKGRILVVEDEEMIRDAIGPFLEEAGYEVSFAQDGKEAFRQLSTEIAPQLIVLDLRMPVMDGWEFRAIQRNDPRLGLIPVVAISADGSAQAAAISADAYLRKPVDPSELLVTVERVLFESERRRSAQQNETERLTSLGRLAANVGHEINNPLTFLMLNLRQSLEKLEPGTAPRKKGSAPPSAGAQLKELQGRMGLIAEMLHDCEVGGERIRVTVSNLQQLSRHTDDPTTGPLDVHQLIDQSAAMVWNQIRYRGRLVKTYGKIPVILGNKTALGQVFLNLLLNAAQSIPEGDANHNAIQITTSVVPGEKGVELVVEISDSGKGISPENMSHLFEPFFTTKPFGEGTGLGLSISHQTVRDHGGRITVESSAGKGTTFRVFLPVGAAVLPSPLVIGPVKTAGPRGRVLVIDDEPLVGRVIQNVLRRDHEVVVVERASDALSRLQRGERFDAILCDLVMSDVSGPEFYAAIAEHWPDLVERLVFMSGGAFTPATRAFVAHLSPRVLPKPFEIDQLKEVVDDRIRNNSRPLRLK